MINKILYLKPYFIISAVISLISIIISLFLTLGENFSVDDFILYFILILPTIISALICYIGNRTKIKHPKLTIFFVKCLKYFNNNYSMFYFSCCTHNCILVYRGSGVYKY